MHMPIKMLFLSFIIQGRVFSEVSLRNIFGSELPVKLSPGPSSFLIYVGGTRDADLIPGLGRSPGGGHDNPPQNSCLEKPHGQRSLAS